MFEFSYDVLFGKFVLAILSYHPRQFYFIQPCSPTSFFSIFPIQVVKQRYFHFPLAVGQRYCRESERLSHINRKELFEKRDVIIYGFLFEDVILIIQGSTKSKNVSLKTKRFHNRYCTNYFKISFESLKVNYNLCPIAQNIQAGFLHLYNCWKCLLDFE